MIQDGLGITIDDNLKINDWSSTNLYRKKIFFRKSDQKRLSLLSDWTPTSSSSINEKRGEISDVKSFLITLRYSALCQDSLISLPRHTRIQQSYGFSPEILLISSSSIPVTAAPCDFRVAILLSSSRLMTKPPLHSKQSHC
jgi:hypothetical protein